MDRRSFVAGSLGAPVLAAGAIQNAAAERQLRCGADGRFKVLMISDLHYRPFPDTQGIVLTERLIDTEKPQVVIVCGDCLSGKDSKSEADVKTSVGNVAAAMEKKQVPWAIVFGNHDQEHFPATGLDKDAVLSIYAGHPYNINAGYTRGLHGAGHKALPVWNSAGTKPVYCLWLIDSGDYFVDGKETPYDWIRSDQVEWYRQTSLAMEKQYGTKVPGLMFFHIPLREFNEMVNRVKIIGTRHEPEAPSPVNSGLFAAVVDRGDIRGIYCGHDHTNNYLGKWKGVELGYDGSLGHHTYPRVEPEDPANGRVRGGRVFEIIDDTPARHATWMRFKDGTKNWECSSEAYVKDNLKG